MSALSYRCSTWTLTKHLEENFDGSHKSMLRLVLNKSWKQYLGENLLYSHLLPISQTIQVRRA